MMVRGMERWVLWLNPVINGDWNSCGVWRWSPGSIIKGGISGFLPIQGSSSDRKSAGASKFILAPLKNSHLWCFKEYTKCVVVQAIYISLFMGGAKNSRYSARLHISSAQNPVSSWEKFKFECRVQFEAAIRKRQPFFLGGGGESVETGIRERETETPKAAKRLCESCWSD